MSYLDDFEHSFMQNTLRIVEKYTGPYDATLLVNCLLGLLVIPKEAFIEAIPLDPLSELKKWGITPESIESCGRVTPANPHPNTLRGLVHNLRNSVSHFRIKPIPRTKTVHSFQFTDQNGLKATIRLDEMLEFVKRLAKHLDEH